MEKEIARRVPGYGQPLQTFLSTCLEITKPVPKENRPRPRVTKREEQKPTTPKMVDTEILKISQTMQKLSTEEKPDPENPTTAREKHKLATSKIRAMQKERLTDKSSDGSIKSTRTLSISSLSSTSSTNGTEDTYMTANDLEDSGVSSESSNNSHDLKIENQRYWETPRQAKNQLAERVSGKIDQKTLLNNNSHNNKKPEFGDLDAITYNRRKNRHHYHSSTPVPSNIGNENENKATSSQFGDLEAIKEPNWKTKSHSNHRNPVDKEMVIASFSQGKFLNDKKNDTNLEQLGKLQTQSQASEKLSTQPQSSGGTQTQTKKTVQDRLQINKPSTCSEINLPKEQDNEKPQREQENRNFHSRPRQRQQYQKSSKPQQHHHEQRKIVMTTTTPNPLIFSGNPVVSNSLNNLNDFPDAYENESNDYSNCLSNGVNAVTKEERRIKSLQNYHEIANKKLQERKENAKKTIQELKKELEQINSTNRQSKNKYNIERKIEDSQILIKKIESGYFKGRPSSCIICGLENVVYSEDCPDIELHKLRWTKRD